MNNNNKILLYLVTEQDRSQSISCHATFPYFVLVNIVKTNMAYIMRFYKIERLIFVCISSCILPLKLLQNTELCHVLVLLFSTRLFNYSYHII
jgi:hypothetical protein